MRYKYDVLGSRGEKCRGGRGRKKSKGTSTNQRATLVSRLNVQVVGSLGGHAALEEKRLARAAVAVPASVWSVNPVG